MKQTDVERHREHMNAAINRAVPENESKHLWPTLKWFNLINVDGHKRVPWCLWCYSECILAYKEWLPAVFNIMRCESKSNRSVFVNFMF